MGLFKRSPRNHCIDSDIEGLSRSNTRPIKTLSATKYLLVGGIAGIILLVVLWSGILDGSVSMRLAWALLSGQTPELSKMVVWGSAPPGLKIPIILHIIDWGGIELSIARFAIWIVGTLPYSSWWKRLR